MASYDTTMLRPQSGGPGAAPSEPPSTTVDEPSPWSGEVIGKVIGFRYRIDKPLAAGGMGSVYLGEQTNLSRQVAVKMIQSTDNDAALRFRREAESLAAVNHPGIVEVYDFIISSETGPGLCFLVMAYVKGTDLSDYLDAHPAGRLDPTEVAQLCLPVVSALVDLHTREMIHRDIKPANIIRTERADGRPRTQLVDFGFARHAEDQQLTATGFVVGTPTYLAPEVLQGTSHSKASDVYALGVTMYKLLTGEGPHGSGDLRDQLRRKVQQEVVLPPSVAATPLGQLLARMLAREPGPRPGIQEVEAELERLVASHIMSANEAGPALASMAAIGSGASHIAPQAALAPAAPAKRGVPTIWLWGAIGLLGVLVLVFAILLAAGGKSAPPGGGSGRAAGDDGDDMSLAGGSGADTSMTGDDGMSTTAGMTAGKTAGRKASDPTLPTPASIAEKCTDLHHGRRLFQQARQKSRGSARDKDWSARIFGGLLASRCADTTTRMWSAYWLSRYYIDRGRCRRARRLWIRHRDFRRVLGKGSPGKMHPCKPKP